MHNAHYKLNLFLDLNGHLFFNLFSVRMFILKLLGTLSQNRNAICDKIFSFSLRKSLSNFHRKFLQHINEIPHYTLSIQSYNNNNLNTKTDHLFIICEYLFIKHRPLTPSILFAYITRKYPNHHKGCEAERYSHGSHCV